MTSVQINLIQDSWVHIKPISLQAGLLFYQKLFEVAPWVQHLFKSDRTTQANKLMAMMGFIVSKLHRLDDIMVDIQQLAQKHNQYGARPEHYDVVGACLIATLKEGLANSWNEDLQAAWVTAFDILKTAMIQAQENHQRSHAN